MARSLGMLGKSHTMRWRNRAAMVTMLSVALLAPQWWSGASFAAPRPAELGPPADSSSPDDAASSFSADSSAQLPLIVAAAQPDVTCPPLEIRRGASTLTIGPGGENATMSLKYQGSFVRTARECAVVDGNVVMKVGLQGRIIVGPAGGPGQVDVPLRIAVVEEAPGNSNLIVTKLIRVPVTIGAGQGNVVFTHVEEGLTFPLPMPATALDDYIVYVGFDPLANEAPEKPERPKGRPKHKAKPGTG